jgi:catechol 2,3-dioxygenase-like lactoylglutathione lyase family enzyme
MITGIGHPAIRARDMEVTAAFYRDVLGMKEAFRLHTGPNGECTSIHMFVAPSQYIEIFHGGENETVIDNKTLGMVHMCYEVDDAAKAIEEMRSRGAVIDTELKTGFSRCRMFWTHDPDGNRIELMELTADCMQQEANDRLAKG